MVAIFLGRVYSSSMQAHHRRPPSSAGNDDPMEGPASQEGQEGQAGVRRTVG